MALNFQWFNPLFKDGKLILTNTKGPDHSITMNNQDFIKNYLGIQVFITSYLFKNDRGTLGTPIKLLSAILIVCI